MVNVFTVSDIIVKHIKTYYPQDVAIVGYYGSYAQGRATTRSDLDFFFIPATKRGRQVECQFIIDGISFDFWPISWERAERMATSEEWNTTIIADCELLYVRSDDDLNKFMALRRIISDMSNQEKKADFINKAEGEMKECLINLAKLKLLKKDTNNAYYRTITQYIIVNIIKSLGFLNQIYYTRSWGHYREQVRKLLIKPQKLDEYLDIMMYSESIDEIIIAAEKLLLDTVELIAEHKNKLDVNRKYKTVMKGYYEEEKGMLNKLLTACEAKHYETAFFVAISVQDGLARILYAAEKGYWPSEIDLGKYQQYYEQYRYPDLISLLDPTDFEPLRLAVIKLITKLEDQLAAEDVAIKHFNTVEQFASFYSSKI